jgi:adenylate cyclase
MSDGVPRGLIAKLGIGTLVAVVAAALAWALSRTPFVETMELKTYDWRVRTTATPPAPVDDIVLVWIDNDSIQRMEPLVGAWPWPRMVHAALIDFLSRAPAKLIVYDVLFPAPQRTEFTFGGEAAADGSVTGGERWTGAESDQLLADSIDRAGNVVLLADATPEELVDRSKAVPVSLDAPALNRGYAAGPCVDVRPRMIPPMALVAGKARAIGHNFVALDADGPVRRMTPFVRVDGRDVPSLPIAAALIAQGLDASAVRVGPEGLHIGRTILPLIEQTVPDFYGPAGRACRALVPFRGPLVGRNGTPTFREFSFYDLIAAERDLLQDRAPAIDAALFKDRIVVVGASASATYDAFAVPFPGNAPGAFIHANTIDALLRGRTMAPAALVWGVGGSLGLALVVGLLGAFATPWALAGLASILAAVTAWSSLYWFRGGVWTPLVQPLLAVGLAFLGQLAWQYFVEGREKRQVKRLFSRYVPKDVYEQLIADPERAALGGKRRTMTVLFSDVRGFTTMSERSSPEEVVGQLNEYFSRMVQVLFEHRGTLDKFVGDMVMGLFGAPLDDEDHAEHAVQAALAMTRALDELNEQWKAAGKPALDIGIGISTGEMVAGNIGSDTIMSYTVIGDTVNLGARLESLNKDYGTRIIISARTHAALKAQYHIRPLGEATVKGKSQPVAIYEVRPS